jgi:hypothetical protein
MDNRQPEQHFRECGFYTSILEHYGIFLSVYQQPIPYHHFPDAPRKSESHHISGYFEDAVHNTEASWHLPPENIRLRPEMRSIHILLC